MDRNSPFYFLLSLALCASAQGATSEKPLYSGSFPWKGERLQFHVSALEHPEVERSRFVASIKNDKGEVQANCNRVILGETPYDINSMTLSCEGRIFGNSTKPGKRHLAKFSFADGLPHPKLMIQSKEVELVGF